MKKPVLSLLIVMIPLVFMSCSSLPLPSSPYQSLFVISTNIDSNFREGEYKIVSVQLSLQSEDTGKKTIIMFFPGASYKAIPVERGRYSLNNLIVTMQRTSGNPDRRQDAHPWFAIDFFVEKNVVQLNARGITVVDNEDGWYRIDRPGVFLDQGRVIKKVLQKDDHWLAWQDYKLVNFP